MGRAFAAALVTFVLIGFQNCGTEDFRSIDYDQNFAIQDEAIDLKPSAASVEGFDLADLDALTFYNTTHETLLAADSFRLNFNTGGIESYNHVGELIDDLNFCLDEERVADIFETIVDAEICFNEQSPNQICTQQYVGPAYAKVHTRYSALELGEQNTGCAPQVDLCDGKALNLKEKLQSLLSDLPESHCQYVNM